MKKYSPGTKVVIEYDFSEYFPFLGKGSVVTTTGTVVRSDDRFVVVQVACKVGESFVLGQFKVPVKYIKSVKEN